MTPQAEHAVVMACDSNYAPYALFLAQQISLAHPNRDFDICIFSQDDIQVPEGLQAIGVKLHLLPRDTPFSRGPNPGRHGEAAYLRLLIPGLVAEQYKRVLYLDSDIYLLGEGIDGLFKLNMHDSSIAAVRDNSQWRTPGRRVPEFKSLGMPSTPYFNSGVLLIDVARFQSEKILERCLDLLHKHPEAVPRHDQSLLNLVMQGQWAEMSPIWNWQYTWSSRCFVELVEPQLVHFIGARKPWKEIAQHLPAHFRRPYATFAATHYPNLAVAAPVTTHQIQSAKELRKVFFKHLMSTARMKKYLDRFDNKLASTKPAKR